MPIKKTTRKRLPPEQRKELILAEAYWLMSERGFHKFTIQELAQRCQMTNAGLLHYFESKDQLLISLLEERDRKDTEALGLAAAEILGDDAPDVLPLETVLRLLREGVKRNSTQPELCRMYSLLRSEAMNSEHPAHEFFRRRDGLALDFLERIVKPHVRHPRSTARQIFALMCGLENQWLQSGRVFNLVSEWDRGMSVLLPRPQEQMSGSGPRRQTS